MVKLYFLRLMPPQLIILLAVLSSVPIVLFIGIAILRKKRQQANSESTNNADPNASKDLVNDGENNRQEPTLTKKPEETPDKTEPVAPTVENRKPPMTTPSNPPTASNNSKITTPSNSTSASPNTDTDKGTKNQIGNDPYDLTNRTVKPGQPLGLSAEPKSLSI
jgi:hypothetical protein